MPPARVPTPRDNPGLFRQAHFCPSPEIPFGAAVGRLYSFLFEKPHYVLHHQIDMGLQPVDLSYLRPFAVALPGFGVAVREADLDHEIAGEPNSPGKRGRRRSSAYLRESPGYRTVPVLQREVCGTPVLSTRSPSVRTIGLDLRGPPTNKSVAIFYGPPVPGCSYDTGIPEQGHSGGESPGKLGAILRTRAVGWISSHQADGRACRPVLLPQRTNHPAPAG
jgi:hypothetical protein